MYRNEDEVKSKSREINMYVGKSRKRNKHDLERKKFTNEGRYPPKIAFKK